MYIYLSVHVCVQVRVYVSVYAYVRVQTNKERDLYKPRGVLASNEQQRR